MPGTLSFDPADHPHRRYNPLTGQWILVSPHRSRRPWHGAKDQGSAPPLPGYAEDCPLCPGNTRTANRINPHYTGVHVFTNDFAALTPDTPLAEIDDGLFRLHAERGEARVICYSPEHDRTLPELSLSHIGKIIECWQAQYRELSHHFPWVQIFENKGAQMGCSIPHPHGQIWAQEHPPSQLISELERQRDYYSLYRRPLLLDYAIDEQRRNKRIVAENADWLTVVPYWAAWPFETMVLPKIATPSITTLEPNQCESLADMLQWLTTLYDNLFEVPFPYSMGWHSAPLDGKTHPEWQLHAHFFPPLLRSAEIRKFMVGYELLAEAQRDLTPEQAAVKLRAQSRVHYKKWRP